MREIDLIDIVPFEYLSECNQLRSAVFITAPELRIITCKSVFLIFDVENNFVAICRSDQNDNLFSFLQHTFNDILVVSTGLPIGGFVLLMLQQIFFNSF